MRFLAQGCFCGALGLCMPHAGLGSRPPLASSVQMHLLPPKTPYKSSCFHEHRLAAMPAPQLRLMLRAGCGGAVPASGRLRGCVGVPEAARAQPAVRRSARSRVCAGHRGRSRAPPGAPVPGAPGPAKRLGFRDPTPESLFQASALPLLQRRIGPTGSCALPLQCAWAVEFTRTAMQARLCHVLASLPCVVWHSFSYLVSSVCAVKSCFREPWCNAAS